MPPIPQTMNCFVTIDKSNYEGYINVVLQIIYIYIYIKERKQ